MPACLSPAASLARVAARAEAASHLDCIPQCLDWHGCHHVHYLLGLAPCLQVAMTTPVRLEIQEGGEKGKSEKIAMTSPVAAEMAGDGSYKV